MWNWFIEQYSKETVQSLDAGEQETQRDGHVIPPSVSFLWTTLIVSPKDLSEDKSSIPNVFVSSRLTMKTYVLEKEKQTKLLCLLYKCLYFPFLFFTSE